ncbi:MAG: hypothetical protein IPN51_03575 [Chloracidobacterium sp.]|nr:hypothetical protein [Chloracidobacterium sp.]
MADTFYVLAVVCVDLKNNRKLSSFVLSTCVRPQSHRFRNRPLSEDRGGAAKTDAQVVAAANFAVAERDPGAMAGAFALDDILSAGTPGRSGYEPSHLYAWEGRGR